MTNEFALPPITSKQQWTKYLKTTKGQIVKSRAQYCALRFSCFQVQEGYAPNPLTSGFAHEPHCWHVIHLREMKSAVL